MFLKCSSGFRDQRKNISWSQEFRLLKLPATHRYKISLPFTCASSPQINSLFDPHFIFIAIHTGKFLEGNRVSDCIMSLSYALNCTVNAVSSLLPSASLAELTSAGTANIWSAEMRKQGNIHTTCLWILLQLWVFNLKHMRDIKFLLLLSSGAAQASVLQHTALKTKLHIHSYVHWVFKTLQESQSWFPRATLWGTPALRVHFVS